jgi:type I restriction enzyme, S subunit
MSEWRLVNLGELTELVTKGTTPPTVGEGFTDQGINYIKSDAVGYEGRINKSLFSFISPSMHAKLNRSQLKENDILFSMAGAFLGKSGLVTADMLPANTNQALAIIRLKKEIAAPRFIQYFLRQKSTVEFVNNMSGQSAQPNINFQEIKSIELALPEPSEQNSIVTVLGSLDDKIDLLHRQNNTLEAMAETLFRQWFVEDAQEGWAERPLSGIANFLNGLACQKYPPTNDLEKLPVLKIRELSSGISETSDWATSQVKPGYIVEAGDVIFAWSASLMVKVWDGEKCVLNQHLFKVTSDEFPKWFYLMWCKHHLAEFIAVAASHATTMGHIKRGDLDAATVLVPPPSVLETMSQQMQPLLDKQIAIARQRKTLEKLRDTLLPKLMSGEVRVAY